MARRYSMSGELTPVVAADSLAWLESAAAGDARISVYDLVVGAPGAAADGSAEYSLYTATGGTPAGTAGTESPLQVGDETSGVTGLFDLTAEPTGIVSLLEIPLNQRASFRWVAAPGGEVVASSSAGNGAGFSCLTFAGTAFDAHCTLHWME